MIGEGGGSGEVRQRSDLSPHESVTRHDENGKGERRKQGSRVSGL